MKIKDPAMFIARLLVALGHAALALLWLHRGSFGVLLFSGSIAALFAYLAGTQVTWRPAKSS